MNISGLLDHSKVEEALHDLPDFVLVRLRHLRLLLQVVNQELLLIGGALLDCALLPQFLLLGLLTRTLAHTFLGGL